MWQQIDDLEALRIAIQTEMDAYKYYKKALKIFRDKDSQSLLTTLADVERKHLKRLEEKYSSLSGKRLLYINLPRKRRYKEPIDPDSTVLQILETAIEQEKASISFYEKAAGRTINARGKQMLEELAEEEQYQIDLLEAEYKVRLKDSTPKKKMALVEA